MSEIFTPKPFADITADMIEHVRSSTDQLTDFNVGSVVRTLLEADAIELDDYYQSIYHGLLKAIPTAIYIGFGFDLQPAVAASGLVRFTRIEVGSDIRVPSGTVFQSQSGVSYMLASNVDILEGTDTAWSTVYAVIPGVSGNDGPGAIAANNGVYLVDSPYSLAGGRAEETEDQRALRFADFVRALARGTIASLEYGARLPVVTDDIGMVIERVQRTSVSEEPGHVYLYIHNGSFGASSELVALVQSVVDGYRDADTQSWVGGYRPAGMRVEVLPLTETPFSVQLEVHKSEFISADTVEFEVRSAIANRVRLAMPGEGLRPVDLINAALTVDGVDAANVLSPLQTSVVPANAIYYLDGFSVSWIN